MVVKKQLGADIIRAGIHLRFQKIHLAQAVGRGRMAFREAGHAYGEPVRIRMASGFVIFTNKSHQFRRMAEGIRITVVIFRAARGISPQGQNGPHPCLGVLVQNAPYFLPAVAYASKVGHRGNAGFMLDAQHHLPGKLTGGAARAVCHADKTGMVRFQFTDGLVQGRRSLLVLGREKFKGQTGARARLQSFSQMHFFFIWLGSIRTRITAPWESLPAGAPPQERERQTGPRQARLLPSCFPASLRAGQSLHPPA